MTAEIKTRVLVVDHEPSVLLWLQGATASLRDRWDLEFVESGEKALRRLTESTFHVVVSEMRMPQMNGAEFLARVKEAYPETARLIITDQNDRGSVGQCIGTAHQFLRKHCASDEIRTAVERACAFKSSVRSDRIRNLVAQMKTLPSLSAVFNELLSSLQSDSASLDQIGAMIGQDKAIATKLLHLVNSGYFGLQSEVTNAADAVSYLGLETVKALILSTQAFSNFADRNTGPISVDPLWRHSLEVAGLAQKIAHVTDPDLTLAEESFVAGMLHDVGKLALAANLPEQYQGVFKAAETLGLSLYAAEEATFGAHHADLGGHILGMWDLPKRVVEAISFHHEPGRGETDEFTPMAAVHLADALLNEKINRKARLVDHDFLDKLGLEGDLPRWREFVG